MVNFDDLKKQAEERLNDMKQNDQGQQDNTTQQKDDSVEYQDDRTDSENRLP